MYGGFVPSFSERGMTWKVETAGWEGRGVVCGKLAPPRLWPPPVLVKDRWVCPREQVLNVLIACQWYGSGMPSSGSPTGAWLTPPPSLSALGEKLGMDPRISQPACCGLCWEPFFSGAVGSVQICRRLAKGCYMWTMWDTYGLGPYTDWAWEACGMLVRFSPVGCTLIWITATLGYE
jgi:hypothetical protein